MLSGLAELPAPLDQHEEDVGRLEECQALD